MRSRNFSGHKKSNLGLSDPQSRAYLRCYLSTLELRDSFYTLLIKIQDCRRLGKKIEILSWHAQGKKKRLRGFLPNIRDSEAQKIAQKNETARHIIQLEFCETLADFWQDYSPP